MTTCTAASIIAPVIINSDYICGLIHHDVIQHTYYNGLGPRYTHIFSDSPIEKYDDPSVHIDVKVDVNTPSVIRLYGVASAEEDEAYKQGLLPWNKFYGWAPTKFQLEKHGGGTFYDIPVYDDPVECFSYYDVKAFQTLAERLSTGDLSHYRYIYVFEETTGIAKPIWTHPTDM